MTDQDARPRRRVVVTGGAGFIGSRAVRLLTEAPGCVVLVLDDLSSGMPMPLESRSVKPFAADIRDVDAVRSAFASFKPDSILHLAAIHHIPTCETQRALALDVNVVGTEVVLEAADRAEVSEIVLASSGAVYSWNEGPLNETHSPVSAADNYGLAKLTNERQLAYWAERTCGRARVARIFNAIGHDDPNAHLIPDILEQVKNAEDPVVELGNVTPCRDYVHADDVARGLVSVLEHARQGPQFDCFNLCSGKEHSVADLVSTIGRAMNRRIHIKESVARKRRIDRLSQLGDPARARSILGWQAAVAFPAAIEDIVARSSAVRGL